MRNSEKQRPYNNVHQHHPDEELVAEELPQRERRSALALSRDDLRSVFSAGAVGGLLAVCIPVALTFLYAETYQEATRLGDKMPYGIAVTIFWLWVSSYIIEFLISFAAGYVVGRIAIRRVLGLYTGLLISAISYVGGKLVPYIPHYPEPLSGSGFTSTSGLLHGILLLILLFVIRALLDGLLGLWGTSTASRKDPYYQQEEA